MGNDASHLKPTVISDLQEDTGLEPELIRSYYKEFRQECKTARMTIDQKQLQTFYCKAFPKGDANSFAGHVFKLLDVDRNGRLDFREFITAVSIIQIGNDKDKLMWIFDLFDYDGTGFINKGELVDMIKTLRSLRSRVPDTAEPSAEEVASYLICRADADADHKLSREEFTTSVRFSSTMKTLIDAASSMLTRPLERSVSFTRTSGSPGITPPGSPLARRHAGLTKPRSSSLTKPHSSSPKGSPNHTPPGSPLARRKAGPSKPRSASVTKPRTASPMAVTDSPATARLMD